MLSRNLDECTASIIGYGPWVSTSLVVVVVVAAVNPHQHHCSHYHLFFCVFECWLDGLSIFILVLQSCCSLRWLRERISLIPLIFVNIWMFFLAANTLLYVLSACDCLTSMEEIPTFTEKQIPFHFIRHCLTLFLCQHHSVVVIAAAVTVVVIFIISWFSLSHKIRSKMEFVEGWIFSCPQPSSVSK